MGGWEPNTTQDLSEIFNFEKNPNPDFIVIGLQEYIDLNTKNIL